jgi:hypothetical protein
VNDDGQSRKKVLATFRFDTSRCMFCGLVWDREMLERGIETVKYRK